MLFQGNIKDHNAKWTMDGAKRERLTRKEKNLGKLGVLSKASPGAALGLRTSAVFSKSKEQIILLLYKPGG